MGNRAIAAILGETWAMRSEALENMLAIAGREHEFAGNLEALEQKLGRPLMNTERATVRDGVAIIPVMGPLFRYANLMTELSGATSYGTLATDLKAAVDDPSVYSIVLQIDSPGGAVKGANEFAKQVREVRGVKPIVAYVGGDGASAAYWIASAADKIVADDSALIGSIGAMYSLQSVEDKPGVKRYSFTSSQSPLKNASPDTPEGSREVQRLVNEMAQVFIESVAANRGIDTEAVLANYGKGAVFTGAEALKRGMIDEIGTFESVIAELSANFERSAIGGFRSGASSMDKKQPGAQNDAPEITAAYVAEKFPAVAEELRAQGVASVDLEAVKAEARSQGSKSERDRISAIEALAVPGTEELIAQLKADGSMTAERAAIEILKAAKTKGFGSASSGYLGTLAASENALTPPKAGSGDTEPTMDQEIKAIMDQARKAGIDA